MFRSAALNYGRRLAAVLLTGMLSDGTSGLWDVRRGGGVTIVQDPSGAEHAEMPRRALEEVPLHYCLPLSRIASTLVELSTDESVPVRRARVLIVEDELVVAINLEHRLQDLGYEVVGPVTSGVAALEVVTSNPPDVVLMDIQLSGAMRGTELGRVLRERFGLPIVYATAYADEHTLAEARPSMPYAFVVKPYRPAQIHAALQLALDQRARNATAESGSRP
jgi:chemotaxis response regulator CheB